MSKRATFSIHRTRDEILDIVPQWLQLLQMIEDRAFYHHPAWYLALNDTLCKDLVFAFFHSDGEPLAIVPVQLDSTDHKMQGPTHDHIALNDWICASPTAVDTVIDSLPAMCESLGNSNWSKLFFGSVPEHSVLSGRLSEQRAGTRATSATYETPWLSSDCRETFWFDCDLPTDKHSDSNKSPIGSKLRRNLKRRRAKLSEQGKLAFTIYENKNEQNPGPLTNQCAFDSFLKIEASGWKGESGTAVASDIELSGFYKQLYQTEMKDWRPSINLLSLDEDPIAAQLQIQTGRTASLVKVGYDEQWAQFSPGFLALESYLEYCCTQDQIARLSLVTCPDWAERWHPRRNSVMNLSFYNRNISGKMLTVVDTTRDKIKKTSTLGRATK